MTTKGESDKGGGTRKIYNKKLGIYNSKEMGNGWQKHATTRNSCNQKKGKLILERTNKHTHAHACATTRTTIDDTTTHKQVDVEPDDENR